MTTTEPTTKRKGFTPPAETRDDLPPLDNHTIWRGVDADLVAVEISPDKLAGFYRLTVTQPGERQPEPLIVAHWGLSANLNTLGVGVVAKWHAERPRLASDADYANTPEIRADIERGIYRQFGLPVHLTGEPENANYASGITADPLARRDVKPYPQWEAVGDFTPRH